MEYKAVISTTEDIGIDDEQCRQRQCGDEADYYVRGESVEALLCDDHMTEVIGDSQLVMVDSEVTA